jgi:hypothetical protein
MCLTSLAFMSFIVPDLKEPTMLEKHPEVLCSED